MLFGCAVSKGLRHEAGDKLREYYLRSPTWALQREIMVMKEKSQNVHAFPPYAKESWAVLIRLSSVRAGRCAAKPLIGLEPCE